MFSLVHTFISCMHKSQFLHSQEEQAAQQQLEELQARPNVKVTAWACHLASLGVDGSLTLITFERKSHQLGCLKSHQNFQHVFFLMKME